MECALGIKMKIFQKIINAILPPRCIKCGEILSDNNGLCSKCFNEISFITEPYCQKCGRPFTEAQSCKKLICANCLQQKNKNLTLNYLISLKSIIKKFCFLAHSIDIYFYSQCDSYTCQTNYLFLY